MKMLVEDFVIMASCSVFAATTLMAIYSKDKPSRGFCLMYFPAQVAIAITTFMLGLYMSAVPNALCALGWLILIFQKREPVNLQLQVDAHCWRSMEKERPDLIKVWADNDELQNLEVQLQMSQAECKRWKDGCERTAQQLKEAKHDCARMHEGAFEQNYWCWMGDGNDHLESLTCPVLIEPHILKGFIDNQKMQEEE